MRCLQLESCRRFGKIDFAVSTTQQKMSSSASSSTSSSSQTPQKKRGNDGTESEKKKARRGKNYTRVELVAIINAVLKHRTYNVRKFVLECDASFPNDRTPEEYKRNIKSKFSDWRKKLEEQNEKLEEGDDVVLMVNNKRVGKGVLFEIGEDNERGVTIHNVNYSPEKDNVEVKSIDKDHEGDELPISVSAFRNMKEAIGGFVPWVHSQLRCPIEDESELDAAWVRFLEDENVLSYGNTEHSSVDGVATEVLTSQHELTNNDKYLNAVSKNSLVANVQAQQHIHYTGNQRELMKLNKSYGKMLDRAERILVGVERDMEGLPPLKKLYLQMATTIKKRSVATFSQLFEEASTLVGHARLLLFTCDGNLKVNISCQRDFEELEDGQLVEIENSDDSETGNLC